MLSEVKVVNLKFTVPHKKTPTTTLYLLPPEKSYMGGHTSKVQLVSKYMYFLKRFSCIAKPPRSTCFGGKRLLQQIVLNQIVHITFRMINLAKFTAKLNVPLEQ